MAASLYTRQVKFIIGLVLSEPILLTLSKRSATLVKVSIHLLEDGMDPVLIENLTSALVLAVVGAIAYALRGLIAVGLKYLEGKIGADKVAEAKAFALMSVRVLKQSPVYEALDPARKKEMAVMWLTNFCQEKGMPYGYDFIDKLVEEAVHVMKRYDPFLLDEETVEAEG
jgi:hypothetical protein